MRFHIFTGNHGAAVQDLALHLQKSLENCGHTAVFSGKLVAGPCNVIIENFGPRLVEMAIDLAHAGTPVIIWASEEITGDTFNSNVEDSTPHYGEQEHWKLRYDNFATVAEHASAIWVPVESLVEPYRDAAPGVPVQFFPHGYAEGYPRIEQRPEAEKDIDFYFSGSATAHRKGLLQALAARHAVVSHHHELPEYVRRDYISRAKVCLSMRLGPHTRLPSVSRMHALVMNGCYVLHEQCPQPSHLDAYVNHVRWEDMPSACEEALRLADRQARADAMRERLRAELPMKDVVPRLLDEVFSSR